MVEPQKVSLILITKDSTYPLPILTHIASFGFGEILILTNSDSPFRKHELFAKAKYELLAYQDDDAICPWKELLELSENNIINVAMKEGHFQHHKDNKATQGLGWGSIFPRIMLGKLKLYTNKYGEDDIFKRETERILTYLNYPQKRLVLPIEDLPSAYAEDRLWRQPQHIDFKHIAEERCALISP